MRVAYLGRILCCDADFQGVQSSLVNESTCSRHSAGAQAGHAVYLGCALGDSAARALLVLYPANGTISQGYCCPPTRTTP